MNSKILKAIAFERIFIYNKINKAFKSEVIKMAEITALENFRWLLSEKGISVCYGFSAEKGIYLYEFSVKNENGNINFVKEEQSILPIVNSDEAIENSRFPFSWVFRGAEISEKIFNKKRVKQLDVAIETVTYKLTLHAVVFPGVSVVKQWWDCENTTVARTNGFTLKPFTGVFLQDDYKKSYWFTSVGGGHTRPTQGEMITRMIGASQKYSIGGSMTGEYMPLFTVTAEEAPFEGFMIALDYLGKWNLDFECKLKTIVDHEMHFTYTADCGSQVCLAPKEKITLPAVTLAAFNGGHDALMKELYDWQYNYMFDLTGDKYYAASKALSLWYGDNLVTTEQFAHRSASFDLDNINDAGHSGAKGVWSDAAWYAPDKLAGYHIFLNSLNGPDFRESIKFANKCNVGYTLWFAGKPLDGVMASKANYWGDFEWRTDAFNVRDQKEYIRAKKKVEDFRKESGERSFHTCDGGGNYTHNFEIQRLSSFNYLSDLNASPYMTYYSSFFEIPDKQCDCMETFGKDAVKYNGASVFGGLYQGSREANEEYRYSRLIMIPSTGAAQKRGVSPERNFDIARENQAIYSYLIKKGVAGRFSYLFHPRVYGDKEYYYRLRTSADRKKALLVISRSPKKEITVFPDGLIKEESYEVGFRSGRQGLSKTGAELMEKGITFTPDEKGELVWFNLPDFPFGGKTLKPKKPVAVYKRAENNIKTLGVGIYISCEDDEGKYYYEIRRNGELLVCLARGGFYFDYTAKADIKAKYTVSAVGFDGTATESVEATELACGVSYISALGNYSGKEEHYNGFSNEYSKNNRDFLPMTMVDCGPHPSGDYGITSNRPGGIEGNFEAFGNTRIARGCHQVGSVSSARVFTADRDMTVRVTGRVMRDWWKNDSVIPIVARIFKNTDQLWYGKIAEGKNEAKVHDFVVSLKKGDKLRFVVDNVKGMRKDAYQYDGDAVNVSWIPMLTLPEKEYEKGEALVSLTGKTEEINGKSFVPVGTKAADGKKSFSVKVSSTLNNVALIMESESGLIDEGSLTVKINGKTVIDNIDVEREKMGVSGKIVRNVRYVTAVNGKLDFEITETGKNKLVCLAVTPENEFRGFYLLAKDKYIDWSGDVWNGASVTGGKNEENERIPEQILPTLYDGEIYSRARVGKDFEVTLDSIPDGVYSIRVLTANIWRFGTKTPEFDIFINGKKVRSEYNVNDEANGAEIALCLRFDGVMPTDGKIKVRFVSTNNAPVVISALLLD